MKRSITVVLMLSACLAFSAAPASADGKDDKHPKNDRTSGAFNPEFDNSPIILCVTKDACRFGGK